MVLLKVGGRVKLSECIGMFLDFKERELSERTLSEYRSDLRLFLRFCGDKDIERVRTADVMLFRSSMKCSSSLINRRMSALSSFFNFLIDMELIEKNPVKRSLRIRKVKQKVPDALSKEEVNSVLRCARERGLRDYLIVKLMLYCGLRVSELLNLRKGDILENGGRSAIRVLGKGGKERFIPISPALSREISEYANSLSSERLFPLSYQGVRFIFEQISRLTGIKLHPHKLRHTFATMLVDRGVDIRVIQEFLGHSSPTTTARYAKVRQEVMFRVAEEILT